MEAEVKRAALGRGLDALFGDVEADEVQAPVQSDDESKKAEEATVTLDVDIDLVEPNPKQPRRYFDEGELKDLAASIEENGVIQPILVRPSPREPSMYEIIAGERRWRASQKAGLHQVPIVIREADDREALAFAIVENVQRADLNPIEEAQGYQQLIDRFAYTQDQVSDVVGKSRPHIANTLRLNNLPDEVQELVRDGALTAGHARAVLNASDPVLLARKAAVGGWSVRQIEQAAKAAGVKGRPAKPAKASKSADTALLEGELSLALQTGVSINDRGKRGGELVISYRTVDDLDRIAAHLKAMGESVMAS